tara:strand:- start:2167 stop:2637 length:471 start_codon:yes stop_codon:yes gene_type:complete
MTVIDQLKGLNTKTSLAISLFFLGLLAPGFLTIYLFKPELLIALETTKLLLFSIAITAPGILLPFVFSLITTRIVQVQRPELAVRLGTHLDWYGVHAITNAFTFYLLLWLSYLFQFSFRAFLVSVTVLLLFNSGFEVCRLIKLAKGGIPSGSIFDE